MLGGEALKRRKQAKKAVPARGGAARGEALTKIDKAGEKLLGAAQLLAEAAGAKPDPKSADKRQEELELLGEEVRDVYVRLRAARDFREVSPAPAGS